MLDNITKQLPIDHVLSEKEKAFLSLYYFVKVDQIAMAGRAQNFNLVLYSLHVFALNFGLLNDFDCNFLPGQDVHPEVDFTKSAWADGLAFVILNGT